jgi:hypothetical protein
MIIGEGSVHPRPTLPCPSDVGVGDASHVEVTQVVPNHEIERSSSSKSAKK